MITLYSSLLYRQRLDFPDVLAILPHGAVGRKEAAARGVEDGLARPASGVAISPIDGILLRDERGVIHRNQIRIRLEQVVHDRAEEIFVAAREVAGSDLIDGLLQSGVAFDVFP